MVLIFGALVIMAAMSVTLYKYGDAGYKTRHIIAGYAGLLFGMCAAVGAGLYFVLVLGWFAAEQKARIINREYGTHYTQEEVFYASDVIDTIRQIQRNRIELNGNLMNGGNAQPNSKQGE